MKVRVLVAGMGVLAVLGLVTPSMAPAQWGRGGGRSGAAPGGGGPSAPYGYPPPGGYYPPPAGYPPPGGYPPPAGYPPQGSYPPPASYAPPAGYPPPGGPPPPGVSPPLAAGAPQAPASGAPPPPMPYAYPQKGQSPEQVTADQGQCATWATQQTGYNPSAPATATLVTATSPGESVGVFGGVTRRWDRREQRSDKRGGENKESQGSPSAAPNPQQTDAYNRALDACLSARGYTVR
jgi:hypothetical protein